MSDQIIVQLIESGTFLAIGVFSYLIFKRTKSHKKSVSNEISLYKDMVFYRSVIEKYRTENKKNGTSQNYLKYRKEVSDEMNWFPTELSKPNKVRSRLEELNALSSELKRVLDKIGYGKEEG